MSVVNSRVGRVTLGVLLTALAACGEEPSPTAPIQGIEPQFAIGDVYTVTNTQDSGIGSLRWALSFTTGGEIIRFDPSLAGHTITLDSSVYIHKSVTIEGPAGGLTIKGNGFDNRLFWARFNGSVTFRNLSITGAYTDAGVGSVIYAEADLTFENMLIHDNTADAGIAIHGKHVTLINSTVTGTTNANNQTYDYAAVQASTGVTLINSTVAGNGWGGVGSFNGSITLRNSIVSNNAGKNCVKDTDVTITREGANLSDDDTCGGPAEIIIADPMLGPLASNGGPTKTLALLAGSPAINAGVDCSVTADQRYVARDGQCDLGAFEFLDFTTVEVTIASSATVDRNGWAVVTGTIRCSRHETFDLFVRLYQTQKSGRNTTDVEGGATTPIACTPSARPWSVSVTASQPFDAGEVLTFASLRNAEPWITPVSQSQTIKLFKSRK